MRYIFLLALFLTACTSRYDVEVAQANADSVRSQALIIQAQENARMFQQLAESAKPVYWPIVVLAVLAIAALLYNQWRERENVTRILQITMQRQVLLPTDARFADLLLEIARERGQRVAYRGDSYFLVDADGQRTPVRQLTVREG